MNVVRKHFNSSLEYVTWLEKKLNETNRRLMDEISANYYTKSEFSTNVNSGIKAMHEGDTKYNKLVKDCIDNIRENIPTLRKVWTPAVAGFFPNVPAYLAGEPESMWRLETDYSEHTPVRVWIGVTSSWGIDADKLARRGAALAAFASALSEIRPVYLTPYVNLGSNRYTNEVSIISWDLQTSPMVLSQITANLANVDVIRYVGLEACYQLDNKVNGLRPPDFVPANLMKTYLGVQPQDLYIGSINLYDKLLTDPINEVKRYLKQYAEEVE